MGVSVKSYSTDRIRNVAVVGHGGSGKTTLVEALLSRAGAIVRTGRVEDGNTVSDTEPEETKRQISLSLAVAPIEWSCAEQGEHKINLLDTPGYADFIGDVDAALSVADLAVFVVSAVEGVEVQAEVLWRRCAALGLPRMVFVNKLDRERSDYARTLDQLTSVFGAGIAPLELPIGSESSFRGVADLLSDQAFIYADDGTHTTEEIPDDLADLEHQVHDNLVEGIVVADDALMERYLEGDVPNISELEHTLAHGVASASVFPVVCGSAAKGIGVDRLADFICEIGPSPAARPVTVRAGTDLVPVEPDPAGRPLAYVFKTIADPYVGQLSVFKVLSGTINSDDHLVNTASGADERLHGLFFLRGKEQLPTSSVTAGDLAAVAKLSGTRSGDTLAPKGTPVVVTSPEPPPALLGVALKPRTQSDDDKLSAALQRLLAEDPALRIDRSDETHQTVMRGTGETHLAVALERLARKFGVNVDTEDVRVPYRETVRGEAEAEGKVKKQTGGHGQFAVAWLRVSPLQRGAGFEFVDKIVGGAIPRQYIPAVQKGIEETMSSGGVHGFPVVDVRVECYDGKYHSVDSSEMAFKTAASVGFKEAMSKAGVDVLEPISEVRVVVPLDYQGDVMGDINSRRGRVQGTNAIGDGEQEVVAHIPTAEILRYAIDLRSMTGGRGRFTAAHDHYDKLPDHLLDKAKATLSDNGS
jgi:elongation factor G